MTGKTLEDKYEEMSRKPAVTNPGTECTFMLEANGLPSRIFPVYDNVVSFIDGAMKKISKMDKKEIACVQKEITLMNRNATDPFVKKTIRASKPSINKAMEDRVRKIDGMKKGTTLSMAVAKKFEELR